MTEARSAEWLARGRDHQFAGRPVDAMLCFRRAIREASDNVDARFHLGEVLWQLGRLPDAIAAWRDAAKLAPRHRASHQALAEALLGTGDPAAAAESASRVLALESNDGRARAIAGVAALWLGDDAATDALRDAIARHPDVLFTPAIGGSLALVLDREPQRASRDALLDTVLAALPSGTPIGALPSLLFALALERLVARSDVSTIGVRDWVDAALARPWPIRDHDALRRAAYAIAAVAPEDGAELAERYSAMCPHVDRGGAPLVWPRRTAGTRLRVAVLTGQGDVATTARAAIAALPADRFAVTTFAAEDASARTIAASDPDVLVDLPGLSAPVGVLLAARPARLRMTIASLRTHNRPPLVDDVARDARELTAALESMQTSPGKSDVHDAAATDALWAQAVDAHRVGNRDEACTHYRRFLEWQPGFAPAHHLLGVALRESGALESARDEFAAAVDAAPEYVAARVDAIRSAIDAGDSRQAAVLAAHPSVDDSQPSLLRAAGSARLAAHDGAGAAACFERALAHEPTDAETHYNHGVALQMARRFGDAARAYQRALAFDAGLIAADFNLGTIFAEQGNRDAAVAAFGAVLTRDPRHIAAYKNRGEQLFATGRFDEWLANFRRFETNCPDALPLVSAALEVCQFCGDFDGVERYLDGLRNERFKSRDVQELVDSLEELLFLLLYFDLEPELIQRFAGTYDHAARTVYGDPLPQRATRRAGKIRVGYLSADLRNHVMGKMMWQAIRHHDRRRFEIAFFSTSRERDEWTERFETAGDRFESVAALDEREAAERIFAADVDLLVDLSTHTRGARPGIVALKPARVQITHVASAGTLGLSTVDFKLTDGFADVPDSQRYQVETLLPMQGCVYPYRHIEVVSGPPLRRAAFGIADDAVVIGAFVNALKLSRRCFALWRQVLERVPRACIAFSPVNAALAPLYVRLAKAGGVDTNRIAFVPQGATDAQNQLRYALVDFVLDPMPYGGANGTLEALDMGVPVVTLVGKRHAERTSFSILSNLGVTQTIAYSGSEYVAIAERLARDPAFMGEVRSAIRTGLAHSPLTDMPQYTRNLEAAYVEALRQRAPEALAEGALAEP